jgi:alpha-tubulin suppressor-like RCC1 family protein
LINTFLDTTHNIDQSNVIITPHRLIKPGLPLSVGENLSNQLGLGIDINDRKKPQIIKDLPENIIQVAAGGMHSACLTEDGIVI